MVEPALRDLAQRWTRYWPATDVTAIVADVRERYEAAAAAWHLDGLRPLSGGVVALTVATGEHVLKVQPRMHPETDEMRQEAEALRAWSGSGAAVELLDDRDDGLTLLMPRLWPGTTLDELVPDYDEQLRIVGALVRKLHAAAAIRHADLHGGNVLSADDNWIAIDPKGIDGEPELDVWLLLCPQAPPFDSEHELHRRVRVYSDAAGLDRRRVAAAAATIAAREAELCADSAFADWPARLRRIAETLTD